MTDTKTCSRPGCGKKLYQSNTSGLCSSGCLSPEAPPSLRARHVKTGSAALSAAVTSAVDEQARRKSSKTGTALSRFKQVCAGLGKDPDDELEAFAQSWLDALLEKLEEAA